MMHQQGADACRKALEDGDLEALARLRDEEDD
jgi:hypothetical protein